MKVSLIWAMTKNRVIGRGGGLPWHLPDEMRYFMRSTLGKPVIMGRKQFESMPRALRDRENIVISRNPGYQAPGARVVTSFEAALALAEEWAEQHGCEEIMVIGGAEIYRLALPHADRLYMTIIDAELEGDTFFPELDLTGWREVARDAHAADARHAYRYSIRVLERATP